jgi:hypothetical protein
MSLIVFCYSVIIVFINVYTLLFLFIMQYHSHACYNVSAKTCRCNNVKNSRADWHKTSSLSRSPNDHFMIISPRLDYVLNQFNRFHAQIRSFFKMVLILSSCAHLDMWNSPYLSAFLTTIVHNFPSLVRITCYVKLTLLHLKCVAIWVRLWTSSQHAVVSVYF